MSAFTEAFLEQLTLNLLEPLNTPGGPPLDPVDLTEAREEVDAFLASHATLLADASSEFLIGLVGEVLDRTKIPLNINVIPETPEELIAQALQDSDRLRAIADHIDRVQQMRSDLLTGMSLLARRAIATAIYASLAAL